jgi:hypothetical protein
MLPSCKIFRLHAYQLSVRNYPSDTKYIFNYAKQLLLETFKALHKYAHTNYKKKCILFNRTSEVWNKIQRCECSFIIKLDHTTIKQSR